MIDMGDRSEEPLFTSLNQRVERLARFSADHPRLTDAALALLAAAVSVVGLIRQGRVTPAMLGFCAALCLPLLLRHHSVRLSFAGVALAALAQWLISGPQLADVTVLIALYWVCLQSRPRSIVIALVAAEAGAVMLALSWEHGGDQFKYWVGVSGLAVASAALGLMIRQRRELLRSLEDRAARLERERDQQAALGAAAERARIAREMHDIVSHNMTVMIALADGARYTLDSETGQAAGAIERVSATGRQALVEMRRLLGVLREESEPGPLEPQPTLERLDDLLARVDAAGIPVTVALDGGLTDLAPGVQLTLFRVAQEALTNTLKHASRPATAHLELRRRGGAVELDVTNTGGGARVEHVRSAGGKGLRGMRERANAYGGQLDAGPTDDGGWRVHLRLAADAPPPDARRLETVR
jgi:signal transduction histidine kinase